MVFLFRLYNILIFLITDECVLVKYDINHSASQNPILTSIMQTSDI
jgi:DNA-directed RNA polymerase subunit L